jgi:hypothetical protein
VFGATTEADLYTVPAATMATVSSIVICNRGAATTFRIRIAIAGAGATNAQYIYYDTVLPATDTLIATCGFTLAATDKICVYAASASVSFSAFGVEVTS